MEPFLSAFLANLAANLASALMLAAPSDLCSWLEDERRKKALRNCAVAGLAALLGAAGQRSAKHQEYLEGVLRQALIDDPELRDDMGKHFALLLQGAGLNVPAVLKLLAKAGYRPDELPGLDLAASLGSFETAFLTAADRQPVLQGELTTFHTRRQTELLAGILDQLQLIATQLSSAAGVSADRIVAENVVAGIQLILGPAQGVSLSPDAARRRYLERLRRECRHLLLAEGTVPGREVTLDRVYIELDTTTEGEEEGSGLSALGAAERFPRLVLLGAPGAGKSSFVKELLARVATVQLGLPGEPPPAWAAGLLPIFVVLRDLLGELASVKPEGGSDEHRRRALAGALRDRLLAQLTACDAGDFGDDLCAELNQGRCLLVLDGLDEVPEERRALVREAVAVVAAEFQVERLIVTCRVLSYHGTAELPHFTAHTLAPLDRAKVKLFVANWYRARHELGALSASEAEAAAADLARAAWKRDLQELAENPMLLTVMARIHQDGHKLPAQRVLLYAAAVKLLLDRWQTHKRGANLSPALELLLESDLQLRLLFERLAYEIQRAEAAAGAGGPDESESSGIDRGVALTLLEKQLADWRPGGVAVDRLLLSRELLDYADQRAGLLVGHGGQPGEPSRFAFPHRTFQEYLAGCHVVGGPNPAEACYELAGAGDFWALAVQLGAENLLYRRESPHNLASLVRELSPPHGKRSLQAQRATLWASKMAVPVQPWLERGTGPGDGEAYLRGLKKRLAGVLGSRLPAQERAEAGRVLARLGDSRPCVLRVDGMELCHVPSGGFFMGTEQEEEYEWLPERPAGVVDLAYGYWLGRFPVTQAQYGEFVSAGGYEESRFWLEAAELGCWQDGAAVDLDHEGKERGRRRGAPDFGEPFSLANHPVVGVTWFEALAFSRWLTERWRGFGWLDGSWEVALPSEAEWEKSARGGLDLLSGQVMKPKQVESILVATPVPLQRVNPMPRRAYPWGDGAEADLMNVSETQLGASSAVGCFPGGRSEYGCEDLSGNVWEWTRSLEGPYPYPSAGADRAKREKLRISELKSRVLRGGSFLPAPLGARCAARNWDAPLVRYRFVGFRVAVLPSTLNYENPEL